MDQSRVVHVEIHGHQYPIRSGLDPAYVAEYPDQFQEILSVRPGITGWAQVNGRNALTWEERFELDVWYVDHRSVGHLPGGVISRLEGRYDFDDQHGYVVQPAVRWDEGFTIAGQDRHVRVGRAGGLVERLRVVGRVQRDPVVQAEPEPDDRRLPWRQ